MRVTLLRSSTVWKFGSALVDRTSIIRGFITAAATVSVFASGTALAISTTAIKEDQAQLRADRAALAAEVAQLRIDEQKLITDTKAGRMAAESTDAERVYLDRQAIRGQKMVIASDKPGSLQMKADQVAVKREEAQLQFDLQALKADTRAGKMSAMSQDAERVYKDQLNIRGEGKDIAIDIARLKADARG
jgi:hypothetical protein